MLLMLLKWIKGYLLIEIKGQSKDRFINICAKHGIIFHNMKSNDDNIITELTKKNYSLLLKYTQKTGVKINILDKKGLPFFFYKYKKRKCFIIGLLLFFIIIYSFTLFIWDINVTGEYIYTKEQIEKDIIKNYVSIGTLKNKIDCKELETKLRENYDKIAWISCEIEGTRLNISFTETIETDKIKKETNPCNIVAAKDGIITDIIVRSGTIVAHKGDEIKKGDILITGAINIYNDYDELIETDYVPAMGEVFAIAKYEYDDSFKMNYYKKEYTGNKKRSHSIIIFNNIITLKNKKNTFKNTDIISTEKKLKIGKTFYLPISIISNISKEYTPIIATYTDKEATEKARKKLQDYLGYLNKKGVEILENNVTIDISDGTCHAKGNIVVKESIGIPSIIEITNQGEDP